MEDAHEISRCFARVEALVGCDMAATSRLAGVGEQWVHDGVVVRGGGRARELWASAQGTPAVVPWDPERPAAGDVNRFRSTFDVGRARADALCEVPVYARFYLPVGLTSDARMLVYDGDRFVCWFGLLRADRARPFRPRELRLLNGVAEGIADALVAVDRRRLSEARDAPGDLLFRATGDLVAACGRGRALIDRGHSPELASLVQRADRHGLEHAVVAGHAVHVTRMEGPGGVRYLLNVRAPRRPRVQPALQLSDRQREVAELAVSGATADEIAAQLEVSRETVRQHLRRVYARLGVASRLELARALDGGRS